MRAIGNTGRLLVLAAGLAALCHAHSGYATGVSPYAPLNLAPEIERDLERVLILGGQPVLRRPIALGLVANALPKACVRDAPLCKRIGRYLRTFDTADNIVFAFLGCHLKGEDLFAYPRLLKRINRRILLDLLDELFDEERAVVSLILPKGGA